MLLSRCLSMEADVRELIDIELRPSTNPECIDTRQIPVPSYDTKALVVALKGLVVYAESGLLQQLAFPLEDCYIALSKDGLL